MWWFSELTRFALRPSLPLRASLQRRARAVSVPLDLTTVLTREAADAPPPADPCAPFGGQSTVRVGRPQLTVLLEGVAAGEVRTALLVVCGPDEFNEAMRVAAREAGYAPERVFVRDTPR